MDDEGLGPEAASSVSSILLYRLKLGQPMSPIHPTHNLDGYQHTYHHPCNACRGHCARGTSSTGLPWSKQALAQSTSSL